MAADFSYERIRPLVESAEMYGSQLNCTFTCKATGRSASASVDMDSLFGKIAGRAVESAKYNLWWSLRNAISNAIWRATGSGVLGRVASDVAYSAMDAVNVQSGEKQYSEQQKQQATVRAFQTVAANFRWDEAQQRWTGA